MVLFEGSMSAVGTWPFSFRVANTLPTAVASFASSPIPPMCMNITLGESQKKWLCSAVTSRPLSSAVLIAEFT